METSDIGLWDIVKKKRKVYADVVWTSVKIKSRAAPARRL